MKLRIFRMLLIYKVFLENVKKNNTFIVLTDKSSIHRRDSGFHEVHSRDKVPPLKSMG